MPKSQGHRVYVGLPRSGKTVLAVSHLRARGGPGVFVDLAGDAPAAGIPIGPGSHLSACRRALQAGQVLHWRSRSRVRAGGTVGGLCRLLLASGGGILAIDEAQAVARQGRVVPEIADIALTGRHDGLEMWLITPVPQLLDFELLMTAEHKYCGVLPWMEWLARWGLTREDLASLRPHEFWKIEGVQKEKLAARRRGR